MTTTTANPMLEMATSHGKNLGHETTLRDDVEATNRTGGPPNRVGTLRSFSRPVRALYKRVNPFKQVRGRVQCGSRVHGG